MTAPVVTNLTRNLDAAAVDSMPYIVELRGTVEPRIKAIRRVTDGHVSAVIQVPLIEDKPLVAVSTMDAIARRILGAGARVYGGADLKGGFKRRMYSV